MASRYTILLFTLSISISIAISSTKAQNQTCERSCKHGGSTKLVPFPFGFSDGCEIRLNCSSSGGFRIGEFEVNIRAHSASVNITAQCNRSIDSISSLFGKHHGLSSENSLLLRDCDRNLSNSCVVPMSLFESRLNLEFQCRGSGNQSSNDSLSCFSHKTESERNLDVLDFAAVKKAPCRYLFSSIAYDSPNSLEFQRLQLRWWMNGQCNNQSCHENATCRNVTLPGLKLGFRCQCHERFYGDGFSAGIGGSGCHRDSDDQGQDVIITAGFYISAATGFFVGFCGIFWALILSNFWKNGYFRLFYGPRSRV